MLSPEAVAVNAEVETALAAEEILPAPRFKFGVFFWICVGWLVVLAIVTIFAGSLHLNPRDTPYYGPSGYGHDFSPSAQHWLGTDDASRDVLSRLIYGAQVSLVIGLFGTAIGIGIGGTLGMISAYIRGRIDAALSFVMYVFLAFPALIAVLCLLEFWGHTESHIYIVLGLFSVPFIYRVVRAATLACATKEYVTAAKSQGATAARVLAKDIFPNVIPSLIAYTVFTFGGILTTEGALGFLGVSVQIPIPSWGNMIGEASGDLSASLAFILAPACALFLTLVSLNYVGERIRQRFDTSEQKL